MAKQIKVNMIDEETMKAEIMASLSAASEKTAAAEWIGFRPGARRGAAPLIGVYAGGKMISLTHKESSAIRPYLEPSTIAKADMAFAALAEDAPNKHFLRVPISEQVGLAVAIILDARKATA